MSHSDSVAFFFISGESGACESGDRVPAGAGDPDWDDLGRSCSEPCGGGKAGSRKSGKFY